MMTRKAALEAGAVALGGALVAGVVLGEHADPAISQPSAKQDAEILNFALLLEYVQAGFHAEALQRAKLTGELADVRADRRRARAGRTSSCSRQALGSAARKPPTLDFGDDTADEERFSLAAFKLEDLGVAAYTAQAPNLTNGRRCAPRRGSSPSSPATPPGSATCAG